MICQMIFSNDLSRSKHIELFVAKANKTLGLIKRLCKELTDTRIRRLLYCTLVRPGLEYASNLWSPYHKTSDPNWKCPTEGNKLKFILNYAQHLPYTAWNLRPVYTIKVSVIEIWGQTLCWTNIKATAVFERCSHYQIPWSKYTLITETVIV